MIPSTAQIVIIGGGAMGASTAYQLAKKGCSDIVVLEKESCLGGHTTSRCAGGFRHQFSTEINVQLSKVSIEMLKKFKEEFDCKYDLDFCGYTFLLTEDDDIESFKASVKMQNELGIGTEWLTSDRIKKMFPMINVDDVVAGTYYQYDGLLDANSVVNEYINEARNLGVKFLTDISVVDIGISKGAVSYVATTEGNISTPIIVNATGPWASEIGKMVNVDIPIKPVIQQLLFTTHIPWVTKELPVVIFPNQGLGFHREGDGLLSGMNRPYSDSTDYNLYIDHDWELLHCEKAVERIPSIENVSIKTRWSGFYEVTPDDHPILGKIPQIDGFYCIAGFSGHGFMHSPVSGKLLSEEIIDGRAHSLDIECLRIERFHNRNKNLMENYVI